MLVFAGDMEWSRQEALELRVAGEMLGIRCANESASSWAAPTASA